MSIIHYLFLGHIEHDGESIRFAKNASESVYKPVIRRPLDTKVIQAVLGEIKPVPVDDLTFAEDWACWMDEGYLVCDKYTTNPEAINFIALLVERTRCDIYDVAAHCEIALGDWLPAAHASSRS